MGCYNQNISQYNFNLGTTSSTALNYLPLNKHFVHTFKVKQVPLKATNNLTYTSTGTYARIPSCVKIDGLFEESTNSSTYDGLHGFNSETYYLLEDFPMWKIISGVNNWTNPISSLNYDCGCLKPIIAKNLWGSFTFVSSKLNPKKFCEFDINGNIIEDPTKFFICNLPAVDPLMTQKVSFITGSANFKNWFTPTQRTKIGDYLTAKGWTLAW